MVAENLTGFDTIPHTLPHFCIESFRRNNKKDALAYKIGETWTYLSGPDAIARIKRIATGLASLGVKAGDRIAIISENRPEWSLTDLAILSLRAVNVPIYTTQAVEQIRYILEDSGAKMLFVSGKKLLKHAEAAIQSVERIEKLITFDTDAKPENDSRALSLADVEARGDAFERDSGQTFDELLAQVRSDDLATIIYTSGTTGEPKGVMLDH